MHYVFLMSILYTVQCATYNQYAATKKYPLYTTSSNMYDQYPYKSDYPSDIAHFPNEATQYPGYNAGYSNKYNNYNTGANGVYYNNGGYSTQKYANSFSSYEFPFMKDERAYCANRSPQLGIDMKGLMGFWYGVEHIQHLGGDSRVDHSRTCIMIHIAEPVEQGLTPLSFQPRDTVPIGALTDCCDAQETK
ncbi:hypothetical protein EVAR_95326_1 [Eumeta japonica]|uniref:Uncharacterized protein n=1 Tax=Eumeta variegata TaxID=151549 RepID=A0A4C1UAK9_EUMVA|nr:hypothetical protein EVAR_95326_1 [Eumeta japonica]